MTFQELWVPGGVNAASTSWSTGATLLFEVDGLASIQSGFKRVRRPRVSRPFAGGIAPHRFPSQMGAQSFSVGRRTH